MQEVEKNRQLQNIFRILFNPSSGCNNQKIRLFRKEAVYSEKYDIVQVYERMFRA